MKFLKDFNKTVNKMGDGVSTDTSPPNYWFGSGNYVLNKIISGNFQHCIGQGRVTGLAGPSGAGKSFLLANIIKQAQKEGAYILLLDSENAFDDDWATAIGIDVTNENYNCIQVSKISHVISIVSAFFKGYREDYPDGKGPQVLIALDSCDMLMTESEAEKYDKGDANADQGQHPKQIKQMLKVFVNDIKPLNASMIVTKQVYPASREQLMKGEGAWVVTDSIRYPLSQILLISRLKLKDGTDVSGIRMKVEGFKTRFTKPFQSVTIEVPYDTGMNECSGLLDVAVNTGIVVKTGGWYAMKDSDKKWRGADIAEYADQILELAAQENRFLQISDDEEVDMSGITVPTTPIAP
jgi:recombination protein RecA